LKDKPLPELKDLGIKPLPDDFSDKMMLICFFDMQQRPSRHCVTQLAKQDDQLQQKGLVAVIIQALNVEQNKLDKWIEENKIPFPVGMIQGDNEQIRFAWGVKSLPWLILTDRKYVVCAEGFSLGELDNKLKLLGDTQ
jgi:hypothetical protein